MVKPALSIVIPTYNRPGLLARAIDSCVTQTFDDLEIVIVDDGSHEPARPPQKDGRLRIVRLNSNRGLSAARNIGMEATAGRWVAFLDDDDQLLPHMAELSLQALKTTGLPPPVGVISGIEVINPSGTVIQTRLPPTLPKGAHFFLEEIEADLSFLCKQSLVVEREVLMRIGGFDEDFHSRTHTELFLRLNPVCSILGLPAVTYRLFAHGDTRISTNPALRQTSFRKLIRKHRSTFRNHPKMFAKFVYKHAFKSYRLGQRRAALKHLIWAHMLFTCAFLKKNRRKQK